MPDAFLGYGDIGIFGTIYAVEGEAMEGLEGARCAQDGLENGSFEGCVGGRHEGLKEKIAADVSLISRISGSGGRVTIKRRERGRRGRRGGRRRGGRR